MAINHKKYDPETYIIIRKQLQAFGKVEICEQRGEQYHFKITEGYENSAKMSFGLMNLILQALGDKTLVVDTCEVKENLFHYILADPEE